MAPAQIIDLSQTKAGYTHKKFQVKRYSHKKFGTREPATTDSRKIFTTDLSENRRESQNQNILEVKSSSDREKFVARTHNSTNITKGTNKNHKNDIFRPYALEDDTQSRKRKHQQMLEETIEKHHHKADMETKRFVASLPSSNITMPALPPFCMPLQLPFMTPLLYYRLQQNQFNAQTFAIALQKQQAAMSLGAMLKRQPNFNLYNLIGNTTN